MISGYNIFVSFHESGKIRKMMRTCINQRHLPRNICGEISRFKKKKSVLLRSKKIQTNEAQGKKEKKKN